jgi:hypothetical protein
MLNDGGLRMIGGVTPVGVHLHFFPRMRLTMWLHMVGISNMMMQRTGFPTDLGYNFNLYLSQQLIDHGKWLVVGSG